LLVGFTLSALASSVLAHPAPASAHSAQNYPAFMCNTRDVTENGGAASFVSDNGQSANGNSGNLRLFCPILSPVGEGVSAATITFWSNGRNVVADFQSPSSVSFELCDIYAAGGGGECQYSAAHTTGSGVYSMTLNPQFPYWDGQGNYDFLKVELGPVAPGGSENVLFGYQITTDSGTL
jgi:hypothetical protein